MNVTNAGAIAMANAIVDLIDVGVGTAQINIYDGTKAVDADTAVGAQVLLAELTLTNPAFGAAADNAPNAIVTANAVTNDASANATGTATWFRVLDRNGLTVWDGTVTATGGGGDMELNSVSISTGVIVSITSWTVTVSEG